MEKYKLLVGPYGTSKSTNAFKSQDPTFASLHEAVSSHVVSTVYHCHSVAAEYDSKTKGGLLSPLVT